MLSINWYDDRMTMIKDVWMTLMFDSEQTRTWCQIRIISNNYYINFDIIQIHIYFSILLTLMLLVANTK